VLACLLALVGCSSLSGTGDKGYITGEGVPTEVAPTAREAAVSLSGVDLEGNEVDLAGLRGKPVVVNVWWSECPPCRVEQPDLNEAAAELGDDVAFLGLNIRDSSA
jgi:thiol-disulfide isomerase/thioredoxin